jgi:phosphoribosylamine--glycine ligase
VQIFHAGTARGEDGSLRVAGGRVLCATGIGKGLEQARERCYGGLSRITFDGMHFRRDIGVAHPG